MVNIAFYSFVIMQKQRYLRLNEIVNVKVYVVFTAVGDKFVKSVAFRK